MSGLPPSDGSGHAEGAGTMPGGHQSIRTPDQRVRVFVSSTLQELAPERAAARDAITRLRLTPVMFELGARPHPPRALYRAYLEQSDIFIGIYWQRYGWVAPDMTISGLEDEYRLSLNKPRLIYIKQPAPDREPRLQELIKDLQVDGTISYKSFFTPEELRDLLGEDLAIMLSERFEMTRQASVPHEPPEEAGPHSGSLPVFRSAIVGREVELAATRQMLLRPDTGLLTLIGAGGTGKTRLGVQLAIDVQWEFKDGVRFVALDSLATPDLVLPAIGGVLGVMETGDTPLIESLKADLAGKQLLLVLDNFEHLAAAAPAVNALLDASAGLKVLVTSRRALRVHGEREFPVPPLDVPDPGRPENVRQLSQSSAVQLFIERARDVRPDFEMTEENGRAVADICRRLDGLPLALELAAARVKILPPRAMLHRLSGGLGLLTGGPRDLPARQQTLSSAIAWSYGLLEASEKQLFPRLAVFVGGFTFEACETVCNAGSDLATGTFDAIFSLVENSLVTQSEEAGAEPRFALLRTIRAYARERLAASGEEQEIRQLHALYYRDLAIQAEPVLSTAEQDIWMRRMGKEQDNVRAALEWCLAQKDRQSVIAALSIAGCLWRFWYVSGHLSEGRRWLERAIEAVDEAQGDQQAEQGIATLKAKALKGLGNLAYWQTDYSAALPVYDAALAINRELGNEKEVASLLNNLGNVNAEMGRPDEARRALEESLAMARRTNYDALVTMVLGNLAGLAIDRGDYQQGRADTEEALELERAAGNAAGMAQSVTNLGIISVALGEYSRAHRELAEALQLLRGLSDDFSLAFAIDALGSLACDEGDYVQARAHHLQALAIRLELGHKLGIIECLRGLAEVAVATGDAERAAHIYGAAEALREEVGALFVRSAQERYERFTATGRAQMGDAAWEIANREGRMLSFEQAEVLARGEE